MAARQHDAVEFTLRAQVHLHPFLRVLLQRYLAVITERGCVRLGGRRRGELPIQFAQFFPAQARHFRIELLSCCGELLQGTVQFTAFGHHRRVRIVRPVRAIHASEHRLQAVVIARRNGIELVVVAARAVDGETLECAHRGHHHVVAVVVARDESIGLGDGQLDVADEIPRPGGDETQRRSKFWLIRKKRVRRQLLLHESRIGFVAVERVDDVVAIRPGIQAGLVLVVAMRLAEVNRVQPVPRPAFAIAWRGQQTVHDLLVGICALVRDERVHFLGRGGQSGEIEGDAAQQRAAIRFR